MQLSESVKSLPLVGDSYAKRLTRLNILSVEDLLNHTPVRYIDFSKKSLIREAPLGELVTIECQIISIRNAYTKLGKVIQEAKVSDGESTLKVVWFRQTYLVRTLPEGTFVALTGKLSFWGREKAFVSPSFEKIQASAQQIHSGRLVAHYRETAKVTSKWIRRVIHKTISNVTIDDYLPEDILISESLLPLHAALKKIHLPDSMEDAEKARMRLAFDELLKLQVAALERKLEWIKTHKSKPLHVKEKDIAKFKKLLPYNLTPSQERSIDEVVKDIQSDIPMNRLLEGDVGSGKTIIAAFGSYVAHLNGFSSVIMAPTQILAEQHVRNLKKLFSKAKIQVFLVTGKTKTIGGEPGIYVGTQALLHRPLPEDCAFITIDEQHRFGVRQRATILSKASFYPHTLTMTATPIPRTIALTLYGDLSLSTLDELPKDRKKIKTWVVSEQKRKSAYKWIEKEIKNKKSQAFIVCPLIDESENITEAKSVKLEYEKLKKVFPRLKTQMLHGKMKAEEKEKVLSNFRSDSVKILVATPVIEVGIDFPNATIIMIESAERFGLAALHQLRGRVGRGEKESYCLLMTESTSEKVKKRLALMEKGISGRELAEEDLALRGPGEIFGTKQSGLPELTTARWTDIDIIKKTRELAETIINNQEKYSKIVSYIKSKQISEN